MKDTELEQFKDLLKKDYERDAVDPPQSLRQSVLAMAEKVAQQLKQQRQMFTDEFVVLAAADRTPSVPAKYTSQSGDWTLQFFEDIDDASKGTVYLKLNAERMDFWRGRKIELQIGEQVLLSQVVTSDELEDDVCFDDFDLYAKWQVCSWREPT